MLALILAHFLFESMKSHFMDLSPNRGCGNHRKWVKSRLSTICCTKPVYKKSEKEGFAFKTFAHLREDSSSWMVFWMEWSSFFNCSSWGFISSCHVSRRIFTSFKNEEILSFPSLVRTTREAFIFSRSCVNSSNCCFHICVFSFMYVLVSFPEAGAESKAATPAEIPPINNPSMNDFLFNCFHLN